MSDDFDPVTYADVNGAWDGALPLPPIGAAESGRLFRKLVTKFGGRKMRLPFWLYRVNRDWAAPKGTDAAPSAGGGYGLPRMVHDCSHWVHRVKHKGKLKNHCHVHAALEKAMIEHVVATGWHLPRAPKVRVKPDQLAVTDAAIKRWTTKVRRAATALKKLERKRKRLLKLSTDSA